MKLRKQSTQAVVDLATVEVALAGRLDRQAVQLSALEERLASVEATLATDDAPCSVRLDRQAAQLAALDEQLADIRAALASSLSVVVDTRTEDE